MARSKRTSEGAGAEIPTGEAFRTEWIDFERGIRVGNLEPHERITQILKYHLEGTYGTPFLTDRWGRGAFWQWICWVSRANRAAKPLSSAINFGCAKFFITARGEDGIFKSGLQVERGQVEGPGEFPGILLQPDWDWHRLIKRCANDTPLDRELHRLLDEEGFVVELGDWSANQVFSAANFTSARQIRAAARAYSKREWLGFQLYYPMPADELRSCSGYELIQAIFGVFRQVALAMNACTQVPLEPGTASFELRGRRV
jgi:hypothetical protein